MPSYNWITNIDWDGSDLEFHCTYEPGERETRIDPGCDPFVAVNKIFIVTEDQNGNDVKVNVAPFIHVEIDEDSIAEDILENLK